MRIDTNASVSCKKLVDIFACPRTSVLVASNSTTSHFCKVCLHFGAATIDRLIWIEIQFFFGSKSRKLSGYRLEN